ncbi:protein of unknown function [Taphrina deformans PYCC 5710]|uniref:Sister chromatid cohesion protein Ctf8 n=1 Tax=Taphrina deformans (strain PYCC 5710 / ATCC 11124 / CBS 356.35 / IMI 108563 / JCM 9778 / NBRC 8474) TaxID=1097556 RepID=R4XLT3_TAPDE|nr:protein of unknown function [Taphrina deformans PYCC 5710]|eukprot:CCG84255.1 protein of unknown function [Taphrina deformans PYCC 5710]
METIISIPPIPSAPVPATSLEQNHFLRLTGTDELVFLEIQGSIARLDESEQRLGRLVHQEDGRIYLIVGYQKMEGKVVTLKTPFAVLRRKKADGARDTDEPEQGTQENGDGSGKVVEMEVVDVCRKKIYFGQRPEPMNEMETSDMA